MAEKYPNEGLPDQITESIDQSEPIEDQHGLLVVQTDQHGTVADHSKPVAVQLQTLEHKVSALQLAQTTGAQTVYNIETQYNVSGGQTIQNIDYSDKPQPNTSGKICDMEVKQLLKKVRYRLPKTLGLSETHPSTSDTKESGVVFDLHECQEELRAYYLDEIGKVNMLPWIPEESKQMDSIFVELDLVRKEDSKASQHFKSNEELVTLKTNQGQRINRVLVTGDAGSGKSTTAGNLAYKWALNDTKSPISQFELVFLIHMKDIDDSSSSLVDMIFQHILPEDSNVSKEGLTMYIKENAKDILFVIDGIDEDSAGALKNKSSGITQLLHNRKLRKSCVILTSRPRNISDLGKHVRHYTQVQLEGFSVKGILKYIFKFFRDDKKIVDLLFRKLKAEAHILALASIPVLLLMICMLWEDQRTTPKTKTQLYQKTIKYLWNTYKARTGGDPTEGGNSDNDDIDEELKDLLNKLGRVALHTISIDDARLTFTVKEFGTEVYDLAYQVGILRRQQSRVGLEEKTSVTFVHSTFQFFCAAFHLANLLDSKKANMHDFDGILFLSRKDALIYHRYVLEFCCGIQPEVTNTFLQHHSDCRTQHASEINKPFYVDISIHLWLIFEGQLSYEQCSNLIPMFSSHSTILDLTNDLIPSVLYMLELYKSSATRTGFLSTITSIVVNTGCTSWLPTLLQHTQNLHDCVVVLGDSGTARDLNMIYISLSELPDLKVLTLSDLGTIGPVRRLFDATKLLNLLTKNKVKLSRLRLIGFQFDENVMVRYLLITKTSILRLGLYGTLNARGQLSTINNVIDTLHRLEHLIQLELYEFQIQSAIKHLRPIMSQLESLALIQCSFHEKHLKALFSFLGKAQKLDSLDLSLNMFSVTLVEVLVECLKKLPLLEILILRNTSLNDESACHLAKFVKERSSYMWLCLDNNPGIGIEGKHALKGLPLKRFVSYPIGGQYEYIDSL